MQPTSWGSCCAASSGRSPSAFVAGQPLWAPITPPLCAATLADSFSTKIAQECVTAVLRAYTINAELCSEFIIYDMQRQRSKPGLSATQASYLVRYLYHSVRALRYPSGFSPRTLLLGIFRQRACQNDCEDSRFL
jgi:hypothetical protein